MAGFITKPAILYDVELKSVIFYLQISTIAVKFQDITK
jgi:hypothetical protein